MKDFAEEEKNRPRRRANTVSVYNTLRDIHNPLIIQKSNLISTLLCMKNISQNILTSPRINICQFVGSFRILYKCVFSYRNFSNGSS